ncbi:methyltransferase domain-containing protein [Xenorhabdus eapokensis]|uniref:Arsenite methyltransferase n=1 Tax=Xenorhabdus eapokensis TaxID=1873482 RepID=A0A1Q5TYI4_9GAMM|nr:methyltransferase domain-containing protein [Xenorhabdus eapokensis]OKP04779.1 arsenite methyltransferase [Xenorhabdus eapokensis]OKP05278.1 arsenite methyltransferase [Xenorhabdus eapokensis]
MMKTKEKQLLQRVENVQNYYGTTLSSKEDLVTNVCTVDKPPSDEIKALLKLIHPDVQQRFYGCGTPFPPLLVGATVLDLGCGGGRDCFILSKLVGEKGKVIGVDATPEQIEFAKSYVEYHREAYGYNESNVHFIHGNIESLDLLSLPPINLLPNSIDVIVSNCVINLATAKPDVLKGIAQLLKPGGEIYFADIFSDRRLSQELKNDPLLIGECIGDVLYYGDFVRIAREAGFRDIRIVASNLKTIRNKPIEEKLGGARLYSMTLRLFKIDLEDSCEDYGQVAIYKGNLPDAPVRFMFDQEHVFEAGKAMPICRNTADIICQSRYHNLFSVIGEGRTHYGIFNCGTGTASNNSVVSVEVPISASGGCGC